MCTTEDINSGVKSRTSQDLGGWRSLSSVSIEAPYPADDSIAAN
jgi:hypothetical protein